MVGLAALLLGTLAWGTPARAQAADTSAITRALCAWLRGFGAWHGHSIGGIAEGAAVGGAAVFVSNGICDAGSGCGRDVLVARALATFIGYFSGSLFGGIIGRTVDGWDRGYP